MIHSYNLIIPVPLSGKLSLDDYYVWGSTVIKGHDNARNRLQESVVVGEDQRNDGIIRLPECRDEEKGKADEDGALVVEFHKFSPCF